MIVIYLSHKILNIDVCIEKNKNVLFNLYCNAMHIVCYEKWDKNIVSQS